MGEAGKGSGKATIYDIAARAGVSTTTVHKVLHNRKGVSPARREEILRIAQELNYTRNTAAHILSRKELHIGVVVEVHNHEFGRYITDGIQSALNQLSGRKAIGHFGRLENSLGRARVLEDFSHMLRDNMDGIILFTTGPYKEYGDFNETIRNRGIPVVTINNEISHLESLCAVLQDGRMLGRLAGGIMELCNSAGHSAVFVGSRDVVAQNDTVRTFSQVVQEAGGEMSVAYETQVENRIGYLLAESLVSNYPDVNGIFVGVSQSIGVMEKLRALGKLGDYRIITVDTYPELLQYLHDGVIVATLDRHPFRMGQLAVHVLYRYLVNGEVPQEKILVQPSVILPATLADYSHDHQRPEAEMLFL